MTATYFLKIAFGYSFVVLFLLGAAYSIAFAIRAHLYGVQDEE